MTDRPDPDLTASRARESLEPEESVVAELSGTGAVLLATDRRVLIVRDRAGFRPRSGIRSWPYGDIVSVSLSRPVRGQGVFVVRSGTYPWQAVSVFFASQLLPEAERALGAIRRHLRQDAGRR
ncbi:MAG: hypothetical protein E6I26_05930 [Chloroflexi bacterium]|nr:MAG: hypothetical protein E6I26_05930 [Chloroflexota bacterium]